MSEDSEILRARSREAVDALEARRARGRDATRRYRQRLRENFGDPPPRGPDQTTPDGVRFAKAIRDCTIDANTGCWIWPNSINTRGYGQFYWNGTIDRAHRISAYLFLGLDPESPLHVLHICDVRRCFNPSHLFTGTNRDNMDDRNAKGHVRRGSECTGAKLDERKVRDIRILAAAGASNRQLGEYYGVTARNIREIVQGRTWRHVA